MPWHAGSVSDIENLVSDWLTLPDVAERLGCTVTKVHGLLNDRALVAARVGERGVRSVPELFLDGDHVVDSLKGTIAVLVDAGFSDDELIAWLYTPDDSLRGRPIDALREGRKTEIRRRAQILAW